MKQASASKRGKLTGLYLRGKTFWFTYRLNGEKKFHSLEITDYGEAVQKALEIRQKPELTPAAVFAREIDASIAHKLAQNEYSRRSAGVKIHALKELAGCWKPCRMITIYREKSQVFERERTRFLRMATGRVKR